MRLWSLIFEPNSLLERKVVYFLSARFLSLIICPLLVVIFKGVSVFARMRLCAVYISRLCLRGALNFTFFSDHLPFFAYFLPYYPRSSDHFCYSSISLYMCSGETAHMSLCCSRGFLIYFGPSCPASELNSYTMQHGEILYMQWKNATYVLNGTRFILFKRHSGRQIISIMLILSDEVFIDALQIAFI